MKHRALKPGLISSIVVVAGLVACAQGADPTPLPRLDPMDDPNDDPNDLPPMTLEPVLECDPFTNASCGEGDSCVYETDTNSTTCRVLDVELELEESCSLGLYECRFGLTCTALPKDLGSSCYQICDPTDGDACRALPGSFPNYMCMPLRGLAYGVCVGAGIQCDPTQDPCGDDEACSVRGGVAVCIPAGSTEVGGDCSFEPCTKGAVCVSLGDRDWPTCFLPCDTGTGTCQGSDEVCTGLEGFNFGICQGKEELCDPLVRDCGPGRTCSIDGTTVRCLAVGPSAVGDSCVAQACAAGGVCVKLLDEEPRCLEPCDLDLPVCSAAGAECSSIGLDFGVCL